MSMYNYIHINTDKQTQKQTQQLTQTKAQIQINIKRHIKVCLLPWTYIKTAKHRQTVN